MQNKKVNALQFQAAVAEAQAYLTVAFSWRHSSWS
jgi:hypothetical protein